MDQRTAPQTPGEVIEEYRRAFPREVVEVYSRPLPWLAKPASPRKAPRRRGKRRGIAALLVLALLLTAAVSVGGRVIRFFRWASDWEDTYRAYQEETNEDTPITIPTVKPAADVRLTLAREHGEALTAQEVYETVSGAVVTVAVDLDGSRMSVGTGVIFHPDGYVLTNHHVVAGGRACTVLLADGHSYDVKFIASDADYDLAVIRMEGAGTLPTAAFGDSDALAVGIGSDAIGTPLDLELYGTFTNGIISAVERDIQLSDHTMTLIQTNTALNSGNSGGPLIDAYGQVVGINVIKMYSDYSTVEGLGFAIPSASAERAVNDLLTYGEVQPEPVLGLSVLQLPEPLGDGLQGLLVKELVPGGAAERAGVQVGDYVLTADGREILRSRDLLRVRRRHRLGDTLPMTLWREGEIVRVTLELTESAS